MKSPATIAVMLEYFDDAMRPAGGDDRSVAEIVRAEQLGLLGGVRQSGAVDQFAEVVAGMADLLHSCRVIRSGASRRSSAFDQAGPAWIALVVLHVHGQDSHQGIEYPPGQFENVGFRLDVTQRQQADPRGSRNPCYFRLLQKECGKSAKKPQERCNTLQVVTINGSSGPGLEGGKWTLRCFLGDAGVCGGGPSRCSPGAG